MSATGTRPNAWKRFWRRRGTGIATSVLVIVVALALAAPSLPLPTPSGLAPELASQSPSATWTTTDGETLTNLREDWPRATSLREMVFDDSEWSGVLGTDALGRDVLSRIVWGARVSLAVGLVATLVSVLIGVVWGATAGFVGGRVDAILMRIVDAMYSVPLLFLVILVVALLRKQENLDIDRLTVLFVVIGAVSWLTMARVVRGQVLTLREREFVVASRALGSKPAATLRRHILPNLWGLVAVYLTLTIPRVVLFEAFLSFLGLGVEPPGVSWGILASEGLESLSAVSTTWWLIVFPGLALVVTLSALNTLGDALRDALDPRTSR